MIVLNFNDDCKLYVVDNEGYFIDNNKVTVYQLEYYEKEYYINLVENFGSYIDRKSPTLYSKVIDEYDIMSNTPLDCGCILVLENNEGYFLINTYLENFSLTRID